MSQQKLLRALPILFVLALLALSSASANHLRNTGTLSAKTLLSRR